MKKIHDLAYYEKMHGLLHDVVVNEINKNDLLLFIDQYFVTESAVPLITHIMMQMVQDPAEALKSLNWALKMSFPLKKTLYNLTEQEVEAEKLCMEGVKKAVIYFRDHPGRLLPIGLAPLARLQDTCQYKPILTLGLQ